MVEANRDEIVRSYYRVRQALGWLGLSLPLLLVLGGLLTGGRVEASISDYYHTILRDIFVGIMFSIAIFLIAYPGHRSTTGEWLSDDLVTTLAGIAALGVALFPNTWQGSTDVKSVSQLMIGVHQAAVGHYVSATIFLSALAYLCLVKFSRTAKSLRRIVYRACGWIIVAMTVGVVVASILRLWGATGQRHLVEVSLAVLWFEALAVWAFSIAWLTKGRADHSLARLLHLPRGRGGA